MSCNHNSNHACKCITESVMKSSACKCHQYQSEKIGSYGGARADLESAMRPCIMRAPAGDTDSLRNKPTSWARATHPQHFLYQPASDLARDLFTSTRINEINCSDGPKCQTRSFT